MLINPKKDATINYFEIEKKISQQLDNYLNFHMNKFCLIHINSLYDIFQNDER